jgi:hypothetical protein
MADLTSAEHIDLLSFEIYDESRHPGDEVIWLASDGELSAPNEPAESFESLPLDPRDASGLEPMTLDRLLEEQAAILPTPAHYPSSGAELQLFPSERSQGDGSPKIPISSPFTYEPIAQFNVTRRVFRIAALVTVLLIGSVLPSILGHLRPTRVKASATVASPSIATQSAARPMNRPVRVLTVMAGREETVKGISIRYVGHFDDDLFAEIRRLNPDLKDPDHPEDGQLIRIPLSAAASVN